MKEMDSLSGARVALVHDWLTGMRGGEKVLDCFCELFPSADLFTLIHNRGSVSPRIEDRRIVTSFIDRLPAKTKRYRHYLPLFPTAIELLDFRGYDFILSTSHCAAKGVRTPPHALHISYLHTPMRYVWDMYEDYFGPDKAGGIPAKIIPFFANYLRLWDVTSSNRVDHFVANSGHVARRIWRYYRREADVVYPPVDTARFELSEQSGDFYLIISALVPYKRVDLAVNLFNRTGKPLYVIGSGPEKERLKAMARPNVRFFDWLSDEEVVRYTRTCRALLFPGEEDFGIVPVEAQACGKPVIAFGKGGALETVVGYDGSNEATATGVFFGEQTEAALEDAVRRNEAVAWRPRAIRAHAQKFSRERFLMEMRAFVDSRWLSRRPGAAAPRNRGE